MQEGRTTEARRWEKRPGTGAVALVSLYDTENNAVRQLAAGLRAHGHRVLEVYFKDWRNNLFEEPTPIELRRLADLLVQEDAALVGISIRASAYQDVAARVALYIRSKARLPIVAGGWHATVRPEVCLTFADAVCLGEADLSFPAFVRHFFAGRVEPLLNSAGFWVKRPDGEIVKNPPLPLVSDLDSLPWRDYTHPDKWWIHRAAIYRGDPMARDPLYQVMCSIGCPQRCSFCHNSFDSPAPGPRFRCRSVSSILDELKARREIFPGIERVRFDDEIFGLNAAWLDEFSRRWPREVGLPFDLMTEPTVVTRRYTDCLARGGATYVHMGIQSTESVNRQFLSRSGSREATRRAISLLTERGMYIRYLVMVDIPGVTEAEKYDLFRFFQEVPGAYDLYLFSLTHFPGCKMVEDKLEAGELDPIDVEGLAHKTFSQYRVDLGYPRTPAETWWIALMVLQASHFVPRRVLEVFAREGFLKERPKPVVCAAYLATLGKTARVAASMLRRHELTPTLIRRWWNPKTMITM